MRDAGDQIQRQYLEADQESLLHIKDFLGQFYVSNVGVWVRSLAKKLGSHMPRGVAKNFKKKKKKCFKDSLPAVNKSKGQKRPQSSATPTFLLSKPTQAHLNKVATKYPDSLSGRSEQLWF